jgi:hypothetical protein
MEGVEMSKLRLTAHVETKNPLYTHIAVFQNYGRAGVLCIATEHAQEVLALLNGLSDEDLESDTE